VLDIQDDKYQQQQEVNPIILESYQRQKTLLDQNVEKCLNATEMSQENRTLLVQHRREYYNDFEDCLREYKNQKIKSLQKQTKVHHSDGDNGDSDADYVDCQDASELRVQSSLTCKSMPHVGPSSRTTYQYDDLEYAPPPPLPLAAFKPPPPRAACQLPETTPQTINAASAAVETAQLDSHSDKLQTRHEASAQPPPAAQLTAHNKDNNHKIDSTSSNNSNNNSDTLTPKSDECKVGTSGSVVNEKSIRKSKANVETSDEKSRTCLLPLLAASEQASIRRDDPTTLAATSSTKRHSCRKKESVKR